MDYSVLVTHILGNEVLSNAVQDMEQRRHALNLVSSEWKSRLENTHAYQTHSNGKATYYTGRPCKGEKAYIRTLKFANEMYPVMLAGEWYLTKNETDDFSIVSRECEPLRLIGMSMRSNSDSQLHDGGRFFVKTCDPILCHDCADAHVKYKIQIADKNWCVKSLRIFDGNSLKNEFTLSLQEHLMKYGGKFMGILYVIIDRRTTYGTNNYKIGGTIYELIVFQNSILLPSAPLNFAPSFNVPSIEFPEDCEKTSD